MRWFRRTLFAAFSITYLVMCPLTILHAFGYSLNPGAGKPLVKTGLIHLSTTPAGASIYLGKRRFTRKTPTTISGLLPGEYTVRLSLKDYRSWERALPVVPEKATVLDDILLLPEQLSPEVRREEPLTGLVDLPGTRFILLMAGPLLGDVHVYDWKEEKSFPLLASESHWRSARIIATKPLGEGPQVLFEVEQAGQSRWLWVEVRRQEPAVHDLTKMLLDAPELFFWSASMRRYLYSFQQDWINRVDLESQAVSPHWIEGLRGFGVSGRSLFILRSDGQCLRLDREGKDPELIGEVALPNPPALSRPSRYQIRAITPNHLMLMGERGELLMPRAPYPLVEKGVIGADWVPRHQKALFWTKQQIGIVHVPDELFDFEAAPQPLQVKWIGYEGRDIQQVSWMGEENHLLVYDNNQLVLLDLQSYGAPHAERLSQSASGFAYLEELGRVYFMQLPGRQLASLQLLPKREILPLPALEYRASGESKTQK